MNKFIQDTI